VIDAAADAAAKGHGAFAIDGRMADAPTVERARRVIERADLIHRNSYIF
jgi:citrate lyase subunit beta/citryl-CoA lyase